MSLGRTFKHWLFLVCVLASQSLSLLAQPPVQEGVEDPERTLVDAQRMYSTGRFGEAMSLLTAAREVANVGRRPSNEWMAKYYFLSAKVAAAQKNKGTAHENYKEMLKYVDGRTALPTLQVLDMKSVAHNYIARFKLGETELPPADDHAQQFVQLSEQTNKKFDAVELLIDLGDAYVANFQMPKAIATYEEALGLAAKLPPNEKQVTGRVYKQVGAYYLFQKDQTRAIENLNNALEVFTLYGKTSIAETAQTRILLGDAYALGNQYEAALREYAAGISVLLRLGKIYPQSLAGGWLSCAKAYLRARQLDFPGQYYHQALNPGTPKSTAPEETLRELAGQAQFGRLPLPQYACALASVRQAHRHIGMVSGDKKPLQVEAQMLEGSIFFETGQFLQAKIYYEKAYATAKTIYAEKHPVMAECLLKLGKIALAEGDAAKALDYINQSLNAAMEEGGEISGGQLPDLGKARFPYEVLGALNTKGVILDRNAADEALQLFDQALELLNQLRKRHRAQGNRYELALLARQLGGYATNTCYRLYSQTKAPKYLEAALRYMEMAKASTLLEALRDLEAKKIAQVPEALTAQERDLKIQIAAADESIYLALKNNIPGVNQRVNELGKARQVLLARYDSLVNSIEQNYKAYYDLKFDFQTPSLQAVQAGLGGGDLLVEYQIADSALFVLVIEKGKSDLVMVPLKSALGNLVARWLQAIRESQAAELVEYGNALGQILLQPIKTYLPGKRLLIVPDGILAAIPFEALPTETVPTTGADPRSIPWLLRQNTVGYHYSAALYLKSRNREKSLSPRHGYLGMAPDFAGQAARTTVDRNTAADSQAPIQLLPLPGAQQEVSEASQLFHGKALQGSTATEAAFWAEASQYGLLHLATHTIINHSNPVFSKLVLQESSGNDGLLNVYELFGMELNAGLVGLSTCNSGSGQYEEGEGIMSMARGFLYAGSPNVLMSLWQVPDAATAAIMKSFYAYLEKGYAKTDALRQAKLDYLGQSNLYGSAPLHWAGFVLVGNHEALDMEQLRLKGSGWGAWWMWAVGVGVLLAGGFFWWKKR